MDVDTLYPLYEETWRGRLFSPGVLAFIALLVLVFALYGLVTFVSAMLSMKPG